MRELITIDSHHADLLRKPAKRVKNPQSTEVILGIQEMKRIATAWEHQTGGKCEGLAATQIGWNARVIILRKTDEMWPKKPIPSDYILPATNDRDEAVSGEYFRALDSYNEWMRCKASTFDPWYVLINPQVLREEGSQESVEGCLSLPGSAYKVIRHTLVIFKYRETSNNMSKVMAVTGKSAVAFEHEVDHIRGILLRDHAIEAYVGEDRQPL